MSFWSPSELCAIEQWMSFWSPSELCAREQWMPFWSPPELCARERTVAVLLESIRALCQRAMDVLLESTRALCQRHSNGCPFGVHQSSVPEKGQWMSFCSPSAWCRPAYSQTATVYSKQFSSVQDDICALGKAHSYVLHPVSQTFPCCSDQSSIFLQY